MPAITVAVESRITGEGRGTPALDSVKLELPTEQITVAALIERAVREQVRSLLERRELEAEEAQRILDRQYLTPKELYEQAEQGAVRYPSRRRRGVREIDPEAEVRNAQQGFADGSYLILVGGRQVERLDEELTLSPESKVAFVRLMPLAGG
ncbi:MAG: hypothetical protein PVH68_18910 [Armatimonadota bacterium]|jgi:hypothetical protein